MYELEQCDDSFAALATFEGLSVDAVITDPPFSAHVHENMCSGTLLQEHIDSGAGGSVPKKELEFDPLVAYGFAAHMVRVSRRWVVSFCAVEDFGNYREAVRLPGKKPHSQWVRGGIWYKPNSMGQLTADRPAAAYEGIAIMHRAGKKIWNGRGSYAYWQAESEEFPSEESHFVCNGTRGEKERHDNQKPLALCLELVAKFSNRGETVLDPFMGSGRIGEACMMLGRNYIGLDRDPLWVARARVRLENALAIGFGAVSDDACLKLCAAPRPGPRPQAKPAA